MPEIKVAQYIPILRIFMLYYTHTRNQSSICKQLPKQFMTTNNPIVVSSEYFAMGFWLEDVTNDLKYAPLNVDMTVDFDCDGYVSEWDDWEGVNYNILFDIISRLITLKQQKVDTLETVI